MKNKWSVIILVVLGMVAALFAQQTSQRSTGPVTPQRYQLIGAQTEAQADVNNASQMTTVHSVFLLDAQTGQVWRYESDVILKDKINPARFVPIER